MYLNGQREEVNLLEGLDLSVLDEPPELGDGDPLLFFLAPPTTTPATSPSPASATATATAAETSAKSPTIGWSCVRHSVGSKSFLKFTYNANSKRAATTCNCGIIKTISTKRVHVLT